MAKRKVTGSFETPAGATKLDLDEMSGLLIDSISTHFELNFAEQQSILDSSQWIFDRNHKDILNEQFFKKLHRRMFQSVWKWAGSLRTTNKNIGVDPHTIAVEIKKLCDDCQYWIDHESYEWNELAARFHHRIVWIHPFPNGNGRFSRVLTDLLMKKYGQQKLSWGQKTFAKDDFSTESQLRTEYILSLREADNKKLQRLINFIQS